MSDENQKPTEEQIREKIARRREEEGTSGGSSEQGPEITPKFVDDCLQTNEFGYGLLFSALYRNKHAFMAPSNITLTSSLEVSCEDHFVLEKLPSRIFPMVEFGYP